jgi:uncharacterized protein YdeI (YjbR/CyaY-like superfamily)
MGKRDPRVDAYIDKAADFAKPILSHLRELVHAGCPEVEETMKWSFPHFEHKGILCSMASFKQHCAFGFWKGSLLAEKHPELAGAEDPAMGQLGRITAISDLPDEETLLQYVREAAALNEQGVKVPARSKPRKNQELEIPDDLMAALRENPQALATFEGFSYSNKKEYVEWLTEAKSEDTRKRRLDQAVEWMAEGRCGTGSTSGSEGAPYSLRSTLAGSSRAARKAGTMLATSAVIASRSATPTKVTGSVVPTPKTSPARNLPSHKAASAPQTTPRAISTNPWRSTERTTCSARAPSAIRMPISCRRCTTM